uniref:MAM domain-containing protein 2-like n=1 Tax=Gasterosteus aculeatus aculeatus TaxID=481459 RepID=UPI001A99ABBA|nr:MAM domain-containing protein 2-like [Gasterosteus aculeatus aculeatus]
MSYFSTGVDNGGLASLNDQEQAVLASPPLDHEDWRCVRLVYQITGGGSLQLHLRPDGDNFDYPLWTAGRASDSWLIASVDLAKHHDPLQHTTFCSSVSSTVPGYYMYVDSVYAKHFQEVAKLTSPMTTVPIAGCLSFYYNRDQERGNIFSVFTRDQLGHYEEIWRPGVYATSGWTQVSVDIKAPHPLEVVFEVAFNSARGGYVAIDDISFSPEFCHTDTEPTFDPSIANCDFENGLCLYHQERTESKVWSIASVKPNAYRIGDHTTGTGRFLVANTRFTLQPGYVGRLHGPLLPGNHKYCLRFYYLLHGFRKVDNALFLYIYDENNVAQEKVWSLTDTSKAVWTEVEITYMKPMFTKVVFVSICKNFWECGLAAIDDITVSLGDCRMTAGSLPGQCDFEGGICGYTQDKREDKADWLRIRGHTPTSFTGPRGDHTTGVGYFMYIEASLMRPGDKARLLTSDLRGSSSPQCLVFYHHMYGSGTGILSVLLRRADGQRDTLLWRRRGEQSVSWMRAMVDYHCDVRHQIVFEAIRGPTLRSDIAIDDIHFKRGPCEDPGDVTPYSGFSEFFNEIEK